MRTPEGLPSPGFNLPHGMLGPSDEDDAGQRGWQEEIDEVIQAAASECADALQYWLEDEAVEDSDGASLRARAERIIAGRYEGVEDVEDAICRLPFESRVEDEFYTRWGCSIEEALDGEPKCPRKGR